MESVDMGVVRGLIAIVSLTTFLGICWWAYRPSSRSRFEEDARLIFDSDEALRRVPVHDDSTNSNTEERDR